MSVRLKEEKAKEAKIVEKKQEQLASSISMMEYMLIMTAVSILTMFIFKFAKGSLQKFLQENFLSEFGSKSKHVPKEQIVNHSSNIPWDTIMVIGIIALIEIIIFCFYRYRMHKIKKFLMDRQEHDSRKVVLEKLTLELVAPDAKGAALSALHDLYAIHAHVENNPAILEDEKAGLVGTYQWLLLAGKMVNEIDEYKRTRGEIEKIGRRYPWKKETVAQKELGMMLAKERSTLLESVDTVAQNMSLLRGELLRVESKALNRCKELPIQVVKQAKIVGQAGNRLNYEMAEIEAKLH